MDINKDSKILFENKRDLKIHSFTKLEKDDKIDSFSIHSISINEKEQHLLPSLDNCLMSEQEISKLSLLDSIHNKEVLTKDQVPDGRLLKVGANILGGGLTTGGDLKLEGSNSYEIYQVFESILLDMKDSSDMGGVEKILNPLIASTHDLVDVAKDLKSYTQTTPLIEKPKEEEIKKERIQDQGYVQELVTKYADRIRELKEGESFTMYGGWHDQTGGHAQIYEIVHEGNGFYSLNFYTSTHDPKIGIWKEGSHTKIQPIVRYRNIPREYLLLGNKESSSVFIQNLVELQLSYKSHFNLTIDTNRVSNAFLYLAPYHVETSIKESGVILGQRSGTCVPSVWKVFVRMKCKDLATYKRLMAEVKFRFLIHLFKRLENSLGLPTEDGKNTRRTLKYLTRNFLRSIAKIDSPNDSFLQRAQASCFDILKRVQKAENNVKEYQKKNVLDSDLQGEKLINCVLKSQKELFLKRAKVIEEIKPEEFSPNEEPQTSRHLSLLETPITSVDQFLNRFKEIEKLAWQGEVIDKNSVSNFKGMYQISPRHNSMKKGGDVEIVLEVQNLIEALPIPTIKGNDFWTFLDEKTALECMNSLEHLLHLYDVRDGDLTHEISPIRYKTVRATGYTIMHRLALVIDKHKGMKGEASLAYYVLPNHAKELLQVEGALFLDSKAFNRLKEMALYCEECNKGKQPDKGDTFAYQKSNFRFIYQMGQFPFWEALIDTSPNLRKILEKESKFFDCPNRANVEVEMSFETRAILMLEVEHLFNPSTGQNASISVLEEAGFAYIQRFRYACFLANPFTQKHSMMGGPYLSAGCQGSMFSSQAGVSNRICIYPKHSFSVKELKGIGIHAKLLEDPACSRLKEIDDRKHEAEILNQYRKNKFNDEERDLIRIADKWQLTPDQMLFHYESELSQFSDPQKQSLFFHLFFRSPITGDSSEEIFLGAGEMLCKEKALRENTLNFIQKGLSYFSESKEKSSVQGQRFFLELAFYCEKYLRDQGMEEEAVLFNRLKWINEQLEIKHSSEDGAILHRTRLLFYSLQKWENLEEDEIASIFISHIASIFNPDKSAWVSAFLADLSRDFILKVVSKLENHKNLGGIGAQVLHTFGQLEKNEIVECISFSESLLKLSNGYVIDLKNGKIYSPQRGLISHLSDKKIIDYWKEFKIKIFGWDEDHPFDQAAVSTPMGDYHFLFKDPFTGGQFLVSEGSISQQFDSNGSWFQYSTKLERVVGEAFLKKHNYWVNLETKEGYLVNKITNKREFCVFPDGKIFLFKDQEMQAGVLSAFGKPEESNLRKNVRILSRFIEPEETKAFSAFTKIENILIFSKNEKIQEVQFTDFLSQTGSPLKFIEKNGKLVWSEQEEYFIATQTPQGLLTSTSQYLYLESTNPNLPPKILVPYDEWDRAKGVEDMWNVNYQTYFVYDIIEDEVVPTTLEAQLHLAHLYAQHKEYGKSMQLLRAIKPVAKFSQRCHFILLSISNMKLQEDHPDAKMVILYATLVELRDQKARAKKSIIDYPISTRELGFKFDVSYLFTKEALDYKDSLNNISNECRLKYEEEIEFLEACMSCIRPKTWRLKLGIENNPTNNPYDYRKQSLSQFEEDFKPLLDRYHDLKEERLPLFVERKTSDFANMEKFDDHMHLINVKPYSQRGSFGEIFKKGEEIGSEIVLSSWTKGNRLFFIKVLALAKYGSENDKKCMLYRLMQWHHLDRVGKDSIIVRDKWIDMMIFAIAHSNDKGALSYISEKSLEIGELSENEMELFIQAYQEYGLNIEKVFDFLTDGKVKVSKQEEFLGHFPINAQAPLHHVKPKKPLKEGLGPTEDLLPSTDKRWEKMAEWKDRFLKETTLAKENEKEDVEEKLPIINAIEELQKELERGGKLLNETPIYSVKEDLENLAQEAIKKKEKQENRLQRCEEEIKNLANKLPKNEQGRLREIALVGGFVKGVVTVEDCLQAALLFNHKAFKELNPHLNKKEIRELQKLLLEREQIKSYQAQLSRIAVNARKGNLNLLAQDLKANYHFKNFTVEQQIAFHVYCGETGMIPFDTQMGVIEEMVSLSTKDVELFTECCIKASTMGSGKSKLISPLVFFLASMQKDKQPLFIAPDALFEVSKVDLSDIYSRAFKRDVQALDARRDELTLYKLQEIKKLLNACAEDKQPLIIKAVFVQTIILECRDQALKLADLIDQKAEKSTIEAAKERLRVLEEIREILGKRTIPIGDEVDQLMRHNKEVNFPIGDKEKIKKELNTLIYHVYSIMQRPELEKLVKLQQNGQAQLSPKEYQENVVPQVIDALFEQKMPLEFVVNRRCCKRFLCNEIPSIVQALADDPTLEITKEHLDGYTNLEALQDDIAFLRQIKIDIKAGGTRKEQAELLCRAGQLFVEILPIALKKNGNQDYGYASEPNKEGYRKIVPYKGVNEPVSLNTEIGHYILETCVSYQLSSFFALSREDLVFALKELDMAAQESVKQYGLSYKETPAYQTCKEFFDMDLSQKEDIKAIEHALEFIQDKPQIKLQLMHDRIADTVSYYLERLSCNGANLARLFSTFLGMSGTPWNAHLLIERLKYTPDVGSEGKIMQKWRKEKTPVINMKNFDSVASFMEQCPSMDSIIDAGAFFKNFGSNRKVAGEILNCLKEPLKVVLFFEENELYMWEKGKEPKCLGGTNNIPLDPETYFVYYDHLHITGADIYQKPNAQAVITFDKRKVTQRDFNQGGKRLRQESQRLLVACIQEEGEKEWGFDEVLSQAAQNQKEQIEEAALIHYVQEIDSLFAHSIDEKIALLSKQMKEINDQTIARTIMKYRKFLVVETEEDPYEQYGRLKGTVDTKKMLGEYLDKKLKAYEEIEKDSSIQKEVEQIRQRIQQSSVLPEKVVTFSNTDREQTVEVEVNTEVNKEQDVDQDREKEQEKELNLYNGVEEFQLRMESKMNEGELLEIINGKKLTPIRHQLQKYKYLHPYDTLFKEDICATDNFYYSTGQVLPIFHKMQKPAEQILFFQTEEGMRAVFVSEEECRSIKEILKERYQKNDSQYAHVWLIQPNGTQLIENPHHPFVIEEDAIMPTLIECNVFGGHVNFLARHSEHTQSYILEGNEESVQLKRYFLQLRCPKEQKATFKTSRAFRVNQEQSGSFLLKSSFSYRSNQKGKYIPKSIQEAQNCPPHKVSQLHVDYVKHLKNSEQIKRLQSWQVPYVEPYQVKNLPFHLVKYLNSKEQMKALEKEQVKHIVLNQAELIPHIRSDFYEEFDQMWQVRAVPTQYIDKISEIHVSKCSEDQLESITINQLPGLVSTPYLFGHIRSDLVHKIPKEHHIRITAKQIEKVSNVKVIEELELQDPVLLNACPPLFFTALSKEQLSKLSPSNIQKLTHEQIVQLIEADKWSAHVCQNLSKEQIQRFDTQELVDLLSLEQITRDLGEQQLKYLKKPEQINACPLGLMTSLSRQQLDQSEKIEELTNEQITTIAQADKWSDSLSEKLSETQIQGFGSQILIDLLSVDQIHEWIRERQLIFLFSSEQINACPTELISSLSQEQLAELSLENVQNLTKELITSIAQANKWSDSLSEKLSETQIRDFDSQILVGLLSLEQITDHLIEIQLPHLTTVEQINACPKDLIIALSAQQLKELSNENVQQLTNEEIESIIQADKWDISLSEKLSAEQIRGFDSQLLIDLLSVDQIRENLVQEQLPYLVAADQINACPGVLVASLTPQQLHQLRPEVILDYMQNGFFPQELHNLLSQEQVIAFAGSRDLMPYLTPAQINAYLSPEHLTYISPEQIRGLVKKELVLALSDEQIGLLDTPEALQTVPLMRVRNFQTKEQFRKRRTVQKIGYAFAILSMGVISTILLIIGFPTLVVPIAYLIGRQRAWKVMTANTSRLTHLFRVGVLDRH